MQESTCIRRSALFPTLTTLREMDGGPFSWWLEPIESGSSEAKATMKTPSPAMLIRLQPSFAAAGSACRFVGRLVCGVRWLPVGRAKVRRF